MKTQCSTCTRSLNDELDRYSFCMTCDAFWCLDCNPHCKCDDIAPDRVGTSAFGVLLRAHMEAKGLSLDDLAFLMSDKAVIQ